MTSRNGYHQCRPPATIAAEIYQVYQAAKQKSQVILEGVDDQRLYGRFADHDHCRLTSAGDKEKALEVLDRLNRLYAQGRVRGYLVIVDSDYDQLLGKLRADPNLLHTDAHSAECMVFREADIRTLMIEFAVPLASIPEAFLAFVEKAANRIGLLRLVSEKARLGLNFSLLDREIDGLFAVPDLELDFDRLVETVLRMSTPTTVTNERVQSELKRLPKLKRWFLPQGHDLMELLASFIRQVTKDTKITGQRVSSVLRLRYDFVHFKKTSIYQGIKNWEASNAPFHILVRQELVSPSGEEIGKTE